MSRDLLPAPQHTVAIQRFARRCTIGNRTRCCTRHLFDRICRCTADCCVCARFGRCRRCGCSRGWRCRGPLPPVAHYGIFGNQSVEFRFCPLVIFVRLRHFCAHSLASDRIFAKAQTSSTLTPLRRQATKRLPRRNTTSTSTAETPAPISAWNKCVAFRRRLLRKLGFFVDAVSSRRAQLKLLECVFAQLCSASRLLARLLTFLQRRLVLGR